ncbi:MAG TPA: Hsp20/alpha crystallin family protein [Candidatus Paceibacterota bacterium]|nr:Hsp20/alpha crystallin family protein [Candidatus Paceibacterota bacterium]
MQPSKKSFFERLTGTVKLEEDEAIEEADADARGILDESEEEGQLTVDVYQTPEEIVLKTMVAGVRPEDLDINITRDMVTIKGKREESAEVHDHDYFHKELYWGSFSRTIMLPEEIEVEEAEAIERHGLLTIKLPKVDKSKQNKLRVKSV